MEDYVTLDQEEDKEDYENYDEFMTYDGEDYETPIEQAPRRPPGGAWVSRHQSTISTYSSSSSSSGFPSGGSLSNDERNRLSASRLKSPATTPQPLNLARNRNNQPETRTNRVEEQSEDEGCYDVIPWDYENINDDDDGLPKNKPLPPTPPTPGQAGRSKFPAVKEFDQSEILKGKLGLRPTPGKAPTKMFNTGSPDDDETPSVTNARAQFGVLNKPQRNSSFIAAHTSTERLPHSNSDPKFPFQSKTPPGTMSSANFKQATSQTKQPHPGQSGPPPVAQKSRTKSEPAVPTMHELQSNKKPAFASVSDSTSPSTETRNFAPTGFKIPGKSTASPTASTPPWKANPPGAAAPTPVPHAPPPFPNGNKFTPKILSANPASSPVVTTPSTPTAPKFPSAQQTPPPWKKTTAEEKATVPPPVTQSAVPAWKRKEVVTTPPAPPPSTSTPSTPSKWNVKAAGGVSAASSTGNKFPNGSVASSPSAAAAVPTAPGHVSSSQSRPIQIGWKKASSTTPSSDSGEVYYNDGQPETPPPRPEKASQPWSKKPNNFNKPEATPWKGAPVPKFPHSGGNQPSGEDGDGLTYQEFPDEPAPPVPSLLQSKLKQFEGCKGIGRTLPPGAKTQGQRYDPVVFSSSVPKIMSGPKFGRGAEMVSCEYEELPENCDPLVIYSWYFGEITRAESESTVLKAGKDGTYLVRKRLVEGGSADEPYCISVVRNRQVHHVIIRQRPDKLWAIGSKKTDEKKFPDVPQLISFYGCNDIDLSVGIRVQLLHCPPHGRS